MKARLISFIFCALLLAGCGVTQITERYGLPEQVEILGNPFSSKYSEREQIYARNPWDLHAYEGRIYIGAGNSSNMGPAQNSGPVPILCFDPSRKSFVKEGTVSDEQIDLFREFDNQLFIPGHDAKWPDDWKWGNLYSREENGKWKKYRSIPNALHVYDLAKRKGKLLAALGSAEVNALALSPDMGESWKQISNNHHRVYAFLSLEDGLYMVGAFPAQTDLDRMKRILLEEYDKNKDGEIGEKEKKILRKDAANYNVIDVDKVVENVLNSHWPAVSQLVFPDQLILREDIDRHTLFPNTDLRKDRSIKIARSMALGSKAFYIGAYVHNDHQFIPFGVYIVTSLHQTNPVVQRILLPPDSRPWDMLVRDENIYLLAESRLKDKTIVKVFHLQDKSLDQLREIVSFQSPTFARSFELVDRDFYFGFGTEIDNPYSWEQKELHPATGYILRIRDVISK